MIVRIFNTNQLRPFGREIDRTFEDFCERAEDPLTPAELWELVEANLANPYYGFWLALGDRARVVGWAMTRLIRDVGVSPEGDLWRVYIKPGENEVLLEGLKTLEQWFAALGVEEISFSTTRNPQAWERRLGDLGFEPERVTFKKKVMVDGQQTSGVRDSKPIQRARPGVRGLDEAGSTERREQPGSADDAGLGDQQQPPVPGGIEPTPEHVSGELPKPELQPLAPADV